MVYTVKRNVGTSHQNHLVKGPVYGGSAINREVWNLGLIAGSQDEMLHGATGNYSKTCFDAMFEILIASRREWRTINISVKGLIKLLDNGE